MCLGLTKGARGTQVAENIQGKRRLGKGAARGRQTRIRGRKSSHCCRRRGRLSLGSLGTLGIVADGWAMRKGETSSPDSCGSLTTDAQPANVDILLEVRNNCHGCQQVQLRCGTLNCKLLTVPRANARASRATAQHHLHTSLGRALVDMAQPRATFVSQPSLLPPRARTASRFTPRRPRAPVPPTRFHCRAPRAVFLPPEGESNAAADDADELAEQGEAAAGSIPAPPPRHGSLSNLDRLLENTEPRYTTWQRERARSSLSTFSYDRPLLGADELNESLRPSHLQRHRHVLAPDEQFAAVFMWDTVVYNSRELEKRAWTVVAKENTLPPPDMNDIVRAEEMAPEAAVQRVFYWFAEWGDIKRYVFRKAEVFQGMCASYEFHARQGVSDWLHSLDQYGVKSVLCSPHPRQFVMEVLQRIGLASFFTSGDIISSEDECESLEQVFLLAAVKAQRPPSKCVVFTDRPSGITAAHDVSSKVVALLGAHAAYEIKSADQTVADYEDLVVYNIRRLFSEQGAEFLDPRTELEVDRK